MGIFGIIRFILYHLKSWALLSSFDEISLSLVDIMKKTEK